MSSWAAIYQRPNGTHWTKFFKDAVAGSSERTREEAEHWLRAFVPPNDEVGGRRYIVRITEVEELT